MPTYEYTCLNCDETEERNVKVEEREHQFCLGCGHKMNRVWNFTGAVWSPTSSGATHK